MKTVYLIRHAKSSWSDLSLQDHDRPLNKRGLRDAPFMAKLLRAKGLRPDAIITSPANRARTTATYFSDAWNLEPHETHIRPEIYEAFTADITALIQELPNNWNCVYIFGHNPAFTAVVNQFSDEYLANLPTCGIVKIEADIADWAAFDETHTQQSAYYYPKQYFE